MTLTWQNVSVPLVGGIDTKSDQKTVLPTKLTELQNGEFTKGGSVRKRSGYSLVAGETTTRSTISPALKAVFSRGDALVATNGHKLYELDEVTDRWLEICNYDATTHTATEIAFSPYQQTYPDVATVNDVTVAVWEDSRGGVRGCVLNESTGAAYKVDWTVASSDAEKPRVVAVDGNLLVFWYKPSTDNLLVHVVRPSDVVNSLADADIDLIADSATTGVFDVTSDGTTAYLAYASDGSVVVGTRACKVSSAGTSSNFVLVTADIAQEIAVEYSALGARVFIALWDGANVQAFRHTASSMGVLAGTYTAAVANVRNVAVVQANTVDCTVMYEVSGATTSDHTVTVVATAIDGAASTTYPRAGLATGAWYMGGYPYVVVAHESRTGLQHAYYLLKVGVGYVGKILFNEGAGVVNRERLPRVSALAGTYQCALSFRRKLQVRDLGEAVAVNATYTHKGTKRVIFNPDATPRGVSIGNTLYLSGSQLWVFDGLQAVESGFHMFPDLLTADIAHNGVGSGNIVSGQQYNYRVYYEWYDANGQRYRSAAITRSFTATAAQQIRLTIPTHAFQNRTLLSVVVYRSEGNDNVFYYRVTSADPTVSGVNGYASIGVATTSVTFDDALANSSLPSREVDYLSQGFRPNFGPEGPEFVALAQGRVWLVGGGQRPNNPRYSKFRFDGTAVDFTPTTHEVTEAPDYGGNTVAISSINDVVVVFKERAIYALEGEGPDDTGTNGYYRVRPISSDSGCSDPGSVLAHADGVYFKSHEGIYLLTQDFTLQYVGAEVEAYNDQAVVAATGVPDTDQLVFLTSEGRTLMYDAYYKQWSTYTNHEGLAADVYRNEEYVYLRTDGALYRRTLGTYLDGGVGYKLKLRTAPLRLRDELQGFWRARRLGILGGYVSSHRLLVGVYYDRDEAPFETFEIDPDSVLELGTWGSDANWGSGAYWGGAAGGRDYRWTHRFKRQKCETIRLEFEDLSTGSAGASFELTELTLEVGLRDGLGRVPAVRKV